MQDFRKLMAWQKAYQLALEVYRATSDFPSDERFGLTTQLRSAAVSIGANIAEGRGRGSDADFRRFLMIAIGSAMEVGHHLMLAKDLGYLEAAGFKKLESGTEEVRRLTWALARTLQARE